MKNKREDIHAYKKGCWYIDTDGKTLLTWTSINPSGDILLSDGRILNESKYMPSGGPHGDGSWGTVIEPCTVGRIFSGHPDQNPNIKKGLDGVFVWLPTNQSFKIGGE